MFWNSKIIELGGESLSELFLIKSIKNLQKVKLLTRKFL